MSEPVVTISEIDYHRNGISGEGFHVATFDWNDDDGTLRHMIGILFSSTVEQMSSPASDSGWDNPRVAVFDRDELAKGNIGFAQGNSWRGDHFTRVLFDAVIAKRARR